LIDTGHPDDVGSVRSDAVRSLRQDQLRLHGLFHGRAGPAGPALHGPAHLLRRGRRADVRRRSTVQQGAQVLSRGRLPLRQKYVSITLHAVMSVQFVAGAVPRYNTPGTQYAGCHQLFVPRHRRSMFGRRAFSVAGPAAWKSLPDSLRDPSRSFDSFAIRYDTIRDAILTCAQKPT